MLETCFSKLDNILGGGLKKGEVTIIAGRPTMCKRTLAINIACNIATNYYHSFYFSTDYNESIIKERINKCFNNLAKKENETENLKDKIFVNDSSLLTTEYIKSTIASASKKIGGIDLIIIDDLKKVFCDEWKQLELNSCQNKQVNRNLAINELREIAREKDVAIILCVNLDRELETRKDHRANIEDLARVIGFEYFPDNIIFIFRDYYSKNVNSNKDIVEVNIPWNRNNISGKIIYHFENDSYKFMEE